MGSRAHNHAKATLRKPINRVRKGSVVTDTKKSVVLVASLKRINPASPNLRASAAHSAAGRLAKKTNGFATADTIGTPSTREASAPPACTSGLKPSASHAVDGRLTQIGMHSSWRDECPELQPPPPLRSTSN